MYMIHLLIRHERSVISYSCWQGESESPFPIDAHEKVVLLRTIIIWKGTTLQVTYAL